MVIGFGFLCFFQAQFFFVFPEKGVQGGAVAGNAQMGEGVLVALQLFFCHGWVHFEEQVGFRAAAAPEGFRFQVHAPVVQGPDGQDAYAEAGNGIK